MKAAFIKNKNDIIVRESALPPLLPDEVKIKVTACGICGTDLSTARDGSAEYAPFGHEVAGTIIELGADVRHVKVGQNVVVESASACGVCANCRNTKQELCTSIRSIFHKKLFGAAQEIIAPAISAVPYEGLSPEIASLSEPLGVAIDLVRLADITPETTVLLMGAGPIGLMVAALAKRKGARKVFASEMSGATARIEALKKIGVDRIIHPDKTPLTQVDFGGTIDRILVTSPPTTLNDAFTIASLGAIISFIGIGHGESVFCKFNANDFHFKKLQLRASFASPALCTPLALQYLREGVVNGEIIISHRFALTESQKAMQTALDYAVANKVIILPS